MNKFFFIKNSFIDFNHDSCLDVKTTVWVERCVSNKLKRLDLKKKI
jgi:hypothetical protein